MSFTFPSGPSITVQVAFSSTPFATSPTWVDITDYVRSVSIKRGRSRELDAFSAGTCSVVLSNADRRFDPEHATGPYVAGLLPMKKIQIVSNYSGTTSYLFTGYVDGWPQSYIEQNDSVVNVTATDGFKVLEMVDLPGSLYELAVTADKPDHWWKLDEASGTVAYDSGYAPTLYNGVYSGSPTLGTAGIVTYDGSSTCVSFTGTGQNVRIDAGFTGGASDFTLEAWFACQSTASAPNLAPGPIFHPADASPGGRAYLQIQTDTGAVQLRDSSVSVSSSTNVVDGSIHHAVGVRSGRTASLYVDGTFVSSVAWSTGATALGTSGPGWIGGNALYYSSRLGPTFNGPIAQVAFWQSALTSTQISQHYAAGKNGLSETTGTRISRILDFAGIPTSDRAIDTGSTTLPAADLSGQSALSYCNLLAQSESGGFYFLGNGNVKFRGRHAFLSSTIAGNTNYTVVQATFSDAAGGITYADFTTQYDDQDINNEARITRSGGTTQFAASTSSQATYGRRTYSLSGQLMASDNEAQSRAQWIIAKRKDPLFRVRTLTIKPHAAPTQTWPQVLSRELEERIAVVRTPQNTGSAITKNVLIQSIEHSFGADLDWTTTYELAPADVETQFLVLDDTVYGKLDTGKLAY